MRTVPLVRHVGLEKVQTMLKEAEASWKFQEDVQTRYLIHTRDDTWYLATLNGGRIGYIPRTCFDSIHRERYEPPRQITYEEASKLAEKWGLKDFPTPSEE